MVCTALSECVWYTETLSVSLSQMVFRYAERLLRISNGRFPSGALDFLSSLRGFDSAKERPRNWPKVLKTDCLRLGSGCSACSGSASVCSL